MIQLEPLLNEWESDSIIDDENLDRTSIETARLHSKYLGLLSMTQMKLRALEQQQKVLFKNKWLWYNGKLSKREMDILKWDYDPLEGKTLLKTDINKFIDADEHLQDMQARIEYLKIIISTLEDILSTLRYRSNTIKNIIDWKKLTLGMS